MLQDLVGLVRVDDLQHLFPAQVAVPVRFPLELQLLGLELQTTLGERAVVRYLGTCGAREFVVKTLHLQPSGVNHHTDQLLSWPVRTGLTVISGTNLITLQQVQQ